MSLYIVYSSLSPLQRPGCIVYIFVMETHLSVFACWCETTRSEVVDFTRAEVFLTSSQQRHHVFFLNVTIALPKWLRGSSKATTPVRGHVRASVCVLVFVLFVG